MRTLLLLGWDVISQEVRLLMDWNGLHQAVNDKSWLFSFTLGEGLDNFWKVLVEGRNCVVDIPADRFDSSFWHDADFSKPGKSRTAKAALIKG